MTTRSSILSLPPYPFHVFALLAPFSPLSHLLVSPLSHLLVSLLSDLLVSPLVHLLVSPLAHLLVSLLSNLLVSSLANLTALMLDIGSSKKSVQRAF